MHVRPGQDQLGHVALLPQFRETRYARRRAGATRLVGRGESAGDSASYSAVSGGVIRSGAVSQSWPIGGAWPKVTCALGGIAGRTCAAARGVNVLVSSQLPGRVLYIFSQGVRWKCLPTERNLLCAAVREFAPRGSFGAAPPNALSFSVRACGDNRALRRSCSTEDSVAPFFYGAAVPASSRALSRPNAAACRVLLTLA